MRRGEGKGADPMRSASWRRSESVWSSPWYPGVTGTPAATMIFLDSLWAHAHGAQWAHAPSQQHTHTHLLEPMESMADAGGPMNVTPAFSHIRANLAFSDRKP